MVAVLARFGMPFGAGGLQNNRMKESARDLLKALFEAAFEGNITDQKQTGVLFSFDDYLELVDYTGRIIRSDKRGAIDNNIPPILQRLSIDPQTWLDNTTGFEKNYQKHFGRRKKVLANTA